MLPLEFQYDCFGCIIRYEVLAEDYGVRLSVEAEEIVDSPEVEGNYLTRGKMIECYAQIIHPARWVVEANSEHV